MELEPEKCYSKQKSLKWIVITRLLANRAFRVRNSWPKIIMDKLPTAQVIGVDVLLFLSM